MSSRLAGHKPRQCSHWNIAKNGWGTDGKSDPKRVVSRVVKLNPDIICLNEMDKWGGRLGNRVAISTRPF